MFCQYQWLDKIKKSATVIKSEYGQGPVYAIVVPFFHKADPILLTS